MGAATGKFLNPSGLDVKELVSPKIEVSSGSAPPPAAPGPPKESARSVRRSSAVRDRKASKGTSSLRIPLFGFPDALT